MAKADLQAIRKAISEAGREAIECRFYLTEVKSQLGWSVREGDRRKVMTGLVLNAAKHGTFGEATPQGQAQMLIQNSAASEMVRGHFDRAVSERGENPCYRVFLVLEEPGEAE